MTFLEIALKNVEAAFREGKKAGITVKKKKLRDSTYESYKDSMITMLNDLAKLEGKNSKRILPKYTNGSTWDKYFEYLIERWETGTLSAGQIHRRVHALEAFRKMVNSTNVCGKHTKIRVGDTSERLNHLKSRGIYRSRDTITASKPTDIQIQAVQSNFNTNTKNGEISLIINQLQIECGARIKSLFKLKIEHIDFNNETITFQNDKNNFTRTVPMTKTAKEILEVPCGEKKIGSLIFTLKDSKGNDMSLEKAVKTVQRYTQNAAKKANVYSKNKRFTTHSNRKRYAQNLYNKTRYMSRHQLKKAIGHYINNQGANQEIIVERIKKELNRINHYRKMTKKEKKGFSHEYLRRLYVSLHLGHSRCDIVLSYINPDKLSSD